MPSPWLPATTASWCSKRVVVSPKSSVPKSTLAPLPPAASLIAQAGVSLRLASI
jgi:hypothetical protein